MSEYWKSLPRKFCEICKCWFADNKASIEFHERGKRHQENVQKRIKDIQKKGIKEYKKQKELEDEMAKIEKAALAAYKKDLQNNVETSPNTKPSTLNPEKHSTSASLVSDATKLSKSFIQSERKSSQIKSKEKPLKLPTKDEVAETPKKWYEGVTDDGYKYYWNAETSESQWEVPEEGYISLEEQSEVPEETVEAKCDLKSDVPEAQENNSNENIGSGIGPQPKVDPYGQWVTVEHHEPEEVDLQLPKPSENIVEVVIPITKDETSLKFKEKTIGQLLEVDPNEEVTFKKRKFTGSSKKNVRQRTTDDD